jgi:hypothetical protein
LDAYSPADAEWILWMEPDAIFDDPSFTFPFEFYQGRDIITVANTQLVAQGDLNGTPTPPPPGGCRTALLLIVADM